jgi:hypothetical protein
MRHVIAGALESFINWIPSWYSYNRLGKSKIIQSSYIWSFIVPIVAKLLSKINTDIIIKIFDVSIPLSFCLPFSWKIFYFSSISFAIASIVYKLKCPAFIKEYNSFQDFDNEGKTESQVRESLRRLIFPNGVSGKSKDIIPKNAIGTARCFVEDFLDKPANDLQQKNPKENKLKTGLIIDDDPIKTYFSLATQKIDKNKVANAFWFVQGYANRSNLLARMICGLFYGIGLILISVIFYQNFKYVWGVSF